jgi:hypothetical protein
MSGDAEGEHQKNPSNLYFPFHKTGDNPAAYLHDALHHQTVD